MRRFIWAFTVCHKRIKESLVLKWLKVLFEFVDYHVYLDGEDEDEKVSTEIFQMGI